MENGSYLSCGLFNDTVSSSVNIASNYDLERSGRGLTGVRFLYLSGGTDINYGDL